MPTILELAEHANLSANTVLGVILGEPASDDVRRRVTDAVAALGPPDYPRAHGHLGASEEPGEAPEPHSGNEQPEPEPDLEGISHVRSLVEQLIHQLDAESRARVKDVELLTEVLIESWRGVDRRLSQIEETLARLESKGSDDAAMPPVARLADWVRQPVGESGSEAHG
jgi:hypothetical protein